MSPAPGRLKLLLIRLIAANFVWLDLQIFVNGTKLLFHIFVFLVQFHLALCVLDSFRSEATSHPAHRGEFRLAGLADLCKRHEASLSYLCISCTIPPRALRPRFVLLFCIPCRDGNVRSHLLAQVGPFLPALVVLYRSGSFRSVFWPGPALHRHLQAARRLLLSIPRKPGSCFPFAHRYRPACTPPSHPLDLPSPRRGIPSPPRPSLRNPATY